MVIGEGGEEWRGLQEAGGDPWSEASQAVVAQARANIERLRKREVTLRVVDRGGQALAGVKLRVMLKRHEFCFGDNLWELDRHYRFGEGDGDRAKYFKRRFADVLTAANALCYWTERPRNDGPKTEDLQGFPQVEGFHRCVDWAASEHLTVKGHPLFWSIPKCVPQWLDRYDYETRMKFAEVRVRGLIAGACGKVTIWDAVNEPMWEPAFKNLARRRWPHLEAIEDIADYVEPVLRWARDEDPDACYLINDYGMSGGQDETPVAADGTKVTSALQRRRLLKLLACLADRGVPPDAVGLQSHTGGRIDHRVQRAVYDEIAAAGLPIHITEFGTDTRSLAQRGNLSEEQIEQLQADYEASYLTTAFGHPAVEAFFFWGFMHRAIRWGDHSSHELKPLYGRIGDLIHKQWSTQEDLVTDAGGLVSFRGFFGQYAARFAGSRGMAAGVCFGVDRQQAMPLTLTAPAAARVPEL